MEQLLARALQFGTWLASAVIGVGLALALLDGHFGNHLSGAISLRIIALGVVMFILLPVLRVLLMLFVFLQEKDYRFVVIAGLVLLILVLGFVIGMRVQVGAG